MEDGLSGAPSPPSPIRGPEDFAEAFKVPRETIHRLETYASLLAECQTHLNLVADSTIPQIWDRHFADSAQLLRLAPKAKTWLDLGSGAGFPGLVIAILHANQASFHMHLVEATAKKCAFLAEAAKATDAPVEIHCMRIEDLAKRAKTLRPDIVCARALAPLPKLLELAAPLMGKGVRGLFLKGRGAKAEIEAAKRDFAFDSTLHPSLTAPDSAIVEISRLAKRKKARA